jgi:phosphoglycolate phosphatase
MKSKNRAIIFDLDGTLIDSAPDISKAMNLTRVKHGFPELQKQTYDALIGLPAIHLLEDLCIGIRQKEKLLREFRNCLMDFIVLGVKLFPGVQEIVDLVDSLDIEIGIATSKPTNLARFTIENSGIGQYKWMIQGTDGFPAKPSPDVILRCMKLMESENFIMIGDRIEDMQASSAAKLPSIGIAQSIHTQSELSKHGADATFQNINELLVKIKKEKILFFDNFQKNIKIGSEKNNSSTFIWPGRNNLP